MTATLLPLLPVLAPGALPPALETMAATFARSSAAPVGARPRGKIARARWDAAEDERREVTAADAADPWRRYRAPWTGRGSLASVTGHERRMAVGYGLRPSDSRACLRTLAGLRHRVTGPCSCRTGAETLGSAVLDHETSWTTAEGRRVLTTEPYLRAEHLAEDLADLAPVLDELGLVSMALPWSPWFPGQTLALAVVPAGS